MNKKIVSLLLICFVALSIVYVCSSTALTSHAAQSIDTMPSRSTIITKEHRQDGKPFPPEPIPIGDPIDNPRPHKQ